MSNDVPRVPEGPNESFRGCFVILLAVAIAIGALGAAGYFFWRQFARPGQGPLKEPLADNSKAARGAGRPTADADAPDSETKSKNRLRQIMLAMHGHHSQFRSFPPPSSAKRDAGGKLLLSWRVYLLPFVDQQPLYQQFHLEEPWDGAHNRRLLDKMPDVYRSRGIAPDGNRTGFVIFQDPQMYQIGKSGPDIRQFRDGTSNTLLVVETGPEAAVPWTRPDDIPFDSSQPLAALGALPKDGFWGGFADGAVRRIKPDIQPEVFRGLLTPNGGEVIQFEREVEVR
jgi:Protein of unknown function (DUF1559)